MSLIDRAKQIGDDLGNAEFDLAVAREARERVAELAEQLRTRLDQANALEADATRRILEAFADYHALRADERAEDLVVERQERAAIAEVWRTAS